MPLISVVFLVISAGVAFLGFSSVKSDIQLIIGVLGLLFSGLFLALFFQGTSQWSLSRAVARTRRIVEDLEGPAPEPKGARRKGAASDFNAALLLYLQEQNHSDAGLAIKALAADALRHQGFLR